MSFSFDSENKEQKLFIARLEDLAERRSKGYISNSDFLTPAEQYMAEKYLTYQGLKDKICFFGGYFAAERKQIFLLPDYFCDMIPDDSEASKYEILREEYGSAIISLEIKGSTYKKLAHRDYLGAILALGVRRSSVGDICISDDHSAMIFCSVNAGKLILSELERIGADKVSVKRAEANVEMSSQIRFCELADTIASDRLDCVVAALCKLPREKAQTLIKNGYCEHNYLPDTAPDSTVKENDVVSARGYGKFIVRTISELTKKGRIRLKADKYV